MPGLQQRPASSQRSPLAAQPRRTLTWEELCRDPNLRDLPFKIETNDRGQIVMSPLFSSHSFYQSDLVKLLAEHLTEGRTAVEFAIRTSNTPCRFSAI